MKNLLYSAKGTNQHQEKYRIYGIRLKTWKSILIIAIVITLVAWIAMEAKADEPDRIISPIPYALIELDAPELETLTPDQLDDWEAMKRMAHKLAPLYGYPEKVIIAQMALESARGTSHFCRTRNNCFGIGAYDSNPDNAFSYENKEQAVLEYLRLIQKRYPKAYQARNNPDRMIELIKEAGYATDPKYVAKIKSLPEWREEL